MYMYVYIYPQFKTPRDHPKPTNNNNNKRHVGCVEHHNDIPGELGSCEHVMGTRVM